MVVDMTGTDWKSALAALGERCEGEEAKNKPYVIRKKRRGVVFLQIQTMIIQKVKRMNLKSF